MTAVMAETYAGAKFAAGGDPLQRTAFVVPAQRHTFLSHFAAAARYMRCCLSTRRQPWHRNITLHVIAWSYNLHCMQQQCL